MLFTNDELSYLLPAVEEYRPEQMSVEYNKNYKQCKSVYQSCIDKLNNLSGTTEFTTQELTYMAVSTANIIDNMADANIQIPALLNALHDKCLNLLKEASNPNN